LRGSPAHTRVSILDCCFGGLATAAPEPGAQPAAPPAAQPRPGSLKPIDGAYTLAAVGRDEQAAAPEPDRQEVACTAFTAGLRDLVTAGLPSRAPWLTFGDLYPALRERLLAVFEAQAEMAAEPGYRGCAFSRASAECHPGDLVEQATTAYRAWVRGLFIELAAAAGTPEPQVMGRRLHLLYDGASQSARLDHDPAAALAARDVAAALLDAALASA